METTLAETPTDFFDGVIKSLDALDEGKKKDISEALAVESKAKAEH